MKKFLVGLAIGIVLGGTGGYAIIKEKAKRVATKENAEKVVKATGEFSDTLKAVFE